MLSMLLLLAAADGARPLPAYEDALRCAGATQAAVEGQEKVAETARVFDSAIFWSLAAMDVARAKGLTAAQAEADQATARSGFKSRLDNDEDEAWGVVKGCVKATPPT